MEGRQPQMQPYEVKPTPDPTVLTTELMLREVDRVVRLLQAEMKGDREVNESRFAAMKHEFETFERNRVEQKTDNATAVTAAISAAEKNRQDQTTAMEKAILKSETSASEQSKLQYATVQESLKGILVSINDIKDRVGKIENIKLGMSEHKSEQRLETGSIVGLIGLGIAFIGAVSIIASILTAQ